MKSSILYIIHLFHKIIKSVPVESSRVEDAYRGRVKLHWTNKIIINTVIIMCEHVCMIDCLAMWMIWMYED